MNREFDYSELIEDYVTGKLSEKQKLEFEAQLEVNPELNKDLMLQQDIISSIKAARKAELKSMLNSVNISSGNGFNYFPIQIAGAVLITSLLAVGTYFYLSEDERALSDTTQVTVETNPENGSTLSDVPPASANGENLTQDETSVQALENKTSEETIEEAPDATSPNEISGQEATKETPSESQAIQKPNDNIESQVGTSGLNVETKKDRNHAFHYQYYEDKLFLYGDFKGNTYEVLKLPTPSGTQLYMSYDGRFYKMEKSRKIKSFERVEDPALIEQLQKLRTK